MMFQLQSHDEIYRDVEKGSLFSYRRVENEVNGLVQWFRKVPGGLWKPVVRGQDKELEAARDAWLEQELQKP